jgi:hypothetical protein
MIVKWPYQTIQKTFLSLCISVDFIWCIAGQISKLVAILTNPQAREKRREIIREKYRSTRRKHPQVENEEDTVGCVTMINGAMSSTLMW